MCGLPGECEAGRALSHMKSQCSRVNFALIQ